MTNGSSPLHEALAHLESNFDGFKKTLIELSKIPSISASPFPPEEVAKSASAIADALRAVGVENVQVLTIEGVHPYVYGDFMHKKGAPTILLYGHHDVQPVGNEARWSTPPFEPVEKGGRLYGRGVADDKGGVMTHVAAVACYLKTVGSLPCNVKFVIEGEEEIGSENLSLFLKKYRKMLDADFIVLSDTANFDTGVPALTYQLRGIVQVDVEVETLKQPRHSGMWGGPIPDPVQVLSRLIADLTAADGKLNVPGLYNKVAKTGAKQLARIRKLAFRETQFKKEAGLLTGVRLSGEARYSVYERMWTRPSLTVIAMESHPLKGASNQIVSAARARLSLRTVPNMDGADAGRLLVKCLTKNPPYGAKVTAKVTGNTPWWTTDPEGPAFEAARRALKAGYGKETAMIGAGGTIGFVGPFAKMLGGVPCLLMGVEDPYCNAHSENESLDIADFKKSIRSAIFLYDELSRVPTK
ncbi:MAG: M20/M25/M40 family metallo-hydrolase [Vicinamibacteria bacterium]